MLWHFSTAVSLFDRLRFEGLLIGVSFCRVLLSVCLSFTALSLILRTLCLVLLSIFFGVVFLFVSILFVSYLSPSLSSVGTYLESPNSFDYMQI